MHADFDEDPINFPPFRIKFGLNFRIGLLSFEVPESRCIHVGQIFVDYYRIGPGSRIAQGLALDDLSIEIKDTVNYVYLPSGSLAAKSTKVDYFIDEDLWSEDAIQRDCKIGLTKWILK